VETDCKKGNQPTCWNFFYFFWKPETNQKFAETDQIKQKPDHWTENLSPFWKSETGKKFAETNRKKGNWPTNRKFITFLKPGNKPNMCGNRSKKRKPTNKMKIYSFSQTLEMNLKYAETIRKKNRKPINKFSCFLC